MNSSKFWIVGWLKNTRPVGLELEGRYLRRPWDATSKRLLGIWLLEKGRLVLGSFNTITRPSGFAGLLALSKLEKSPARSAGVGTNALRPPRLSTFRVP